MKKRYNSLFVFDGMDKAGKTTSLEKIKEVMGDRKLLDATLDLVAPADGFTNAVKSDIYRFLDPSNVEFYREPTGNHYGQEIRKRLSTIPSPLLLPTLSPDELHQARIGTYELVLLFTKDRTEQFRENKIVEKLNNKKCIIYDRFYYTTMAYQTTYMERLNDALYGVDNQNVILQTILDLSRDFPDPPNRNIFLLTISKALYEERCSKDKNLESMEKDFTFQLANAIKFRTYLDPVEIEDVRNPLQVVDEFIRRVVFLANSRLI